MFLKGYDLVVFRAAVVSGSGVFRQVLGFRVLGLLRVQGCLEFRVICGLVAGCCLGFGVVQGVGSWGFTLWGCLRLFRVLV